MFKQAGGGARIECTQGRSKGRQEIVANENRGKEIESPMRERLQLQLKRSFR